MLDSTDRVAAVDGFSGPEAVRYDPDQDVYFVSNFTGGGMDRDSNGFISRMTPDGTIDSLRFMTGTEASPLHAPRGLFITGDTLWAADVDGVHGFNRQTGAQEVFVDFRDLEPGFLNDVAATPDGILYVTDTGTSKVYRLNGRSVTVAVDSLPDAPNGITWDPAAGHLVLAAWGGGRTVWAWHPGMASPDSLRTLSGGYMDGVEPVDGGLLIATQSDSSLHRVDGSTETVVIRTPGPPADIGIDTQRRRVAVPYIALDRVDVWEMGEMGDGK